MFKTLNRRVPARIAIIILVLCAFLVGMLAVRQYSEIVKEELEKSKERISEPSGETLASRSPACQILSKGNLDIPPLYAEGVVWGQPILVDKYFVEIWEPERDIPGTKELSGCLIRSSEYGPEGHGVDSYYVEELLKRGWTLLLVADMPGFYRSFQKGQRYFVVKGDLILGFFGPVDKPPPEQPSARWQVELFLSQ